MLIGGLVWLLVVFVPIMLLTAHQKAVLLHRGMMTTGRIVRIHGPGGRSHAFDVTYAYRVAADSGADTREYVEHRGARKGDLAAIEARPDVEVIYDPREPEHSDIAVLFEADRRSPYREALERICLLCAAFAAISGLCVTAEHRVTERERRLLVSGALAKADVTNVRLVGRKYRSLTVYYSFRDTDGRVVSGVRRGVSADLLKKDWRASLPLAAIKDARTVLFDPLDPSRNMLYPGVRWCCRSYE